MRHRTQDTKALAHDKAMLAAIQEKKTIEKPDVRHLNKRGCGMPQTTKIRLKIIWQVWIR